MTEKMSKSRKQKTIGYAWVGIGDDNNPIDIAWYKEHLQSNIKQIRVKLIKIRS